MGGAEQHNLRRLWQQSGPVANVHSLSRRGDLRQGGAEKSRDGFPRQGQPCRGHSRTAVWQYCPDSALEHYAAEREIAGQVCRLPVLLQKENDGY